MPLTAVSNNPHQAALDAAKQAALHRLEVVAVTARQHGCASKATATGDYCGDCAQVAEGKAATAIEHVYWDELEMKRHGWVDKKSRRCAAADSVKQYDSLNKGLNQDGEKSAMKPHASVSAIASELRDVKFATAHNDPSTVTSVASVIAGNVDDLLDARDLGGRRHSDMKMCTIALSDGKFVKTTSMPAKDGTISSADIPCESCSRKYGAVYMSDHNSLAYVERTPQHRVLIVARQPHTQAPGAQEKEL